MVFEKFAEKTDAARHTKKAAAAEFLEKKTCTKNKSASR